MIKFTATVVIVMVVLSVLAALVLAVAVMAVAVAAVLDVTAREDDRVASLRGTETDPASLALRGVAPERAGTRAPAPDRDHKRSENGVNR